MINKGLIDIIVVAGFLWWLLSSIYNLIKGWLDRKKIFYVHVVWSGIVPNEHIKVYCLLLG